MLFSVGFKKSKKKSENGSWSWLKVICLDLEVLWDQDGVLKCLSLWTDAQTAWGCILPLLSLWESTAWEIKASECVTKKKMEGLRVKHLSCLFPCYWTLSTSGVSRGWNLLGLPKCQPIPPKAWLAICQIIDGTSVQSKFDSVSDVRLLDGACFQWYDLLLRT